MTLVILTGTVLGSCLGLYLGRLSLGTPFRIDT